jgi:cytochrome d ubiquinol oxidase subunit II
LAVHGALYVAVKTDGDLQQRARVLVRRMWIVLLAVTVLSLAATMIARPDSVANYRNYPIAFVIPVLVLWD